MRKIGLPLRRNEQVLLLLDLVLATALALGSDRFLTPDNLIDLVVGASFQGILAIGLLVVLLSGGLDISFTAIASVSQYGMVLALPFVDLGWFGAFAIAGGIGILLGLINGGLVSALKVSPIIVTIATLNIFYGALVYGSGGVWLYDFPEWFSDGLPLVVGNTKIPLQIVVFGIVGILTGFVLNHSALGRLIRALGSNPESARRQGIRTVRLHLLVYAFMGLCAGIASVVQAQLVMSVAPNALVGRELDVLAAVVLGGASLSGGRGTVSGTLLSLLLLAMLQNGFTLLGLSSYWFQVVMGMVVIGGVAAMIYGNQLGNSHKGRPWAAGGAIW
jgi:simple sugar transport system permease protein